MAGEQPNKEMDWRNALETAVTTDGSLLGVYDRFHNYSYTNQVLFLEQGYHEPMGSWATWKKLGRFVLKESRAGLVIVPLIVHEPEPRSDDDEQLEDKRERVARLIGFKLVRGVFPLSATGGKELPHVEPPGWSLAQALDKMGIREVPFDQTAGNIQGWSRGLEFGINPLAVNRNKTVFHELGHIALGHTLPDRHNEHAQHRGLMEGEAEAVALLITKEVGLLDDETASHIRGYLKHWMGDDGFPEKSIRRIFRTVEAILRAGRVATAATE